MIYYLLKCVNMQKVFFLYCDKINQALQNFMLAIIGKSNLQWLRLSSTVKPSSLLQNIH